jgi:anti-sigma factor ChrR (cupin superfamily)
MQYINFAENSELQNRAQPMAERIIALLDDFLAQARRVAEGAKADKTETQII